MPALLLVNPEGISPCAGLRFVVTQIKDGLVGSEDPSPLGPAALTAQLGAPGLWQALQSLSSEFPAAT